MWDVQYMEEGEEAAEVGATLCDFSNRTARSRKRRHESLVVWAKPVGVVASGGGGQGHTCCRGTCGCPGGGGKRHGPVCLETSRVKDGRLVRDKAWRQPGGPRHTRNDLGAIHKGSPYDSIIIINASFNSVMQSKHCI